MKRHKHRTLEELYEVTEEILEPEITPVLRGSFRIQGPIEEADFQVRRNTRSSQAGKRPDRSLSIQKVRMRAESGTCNVCAAPCTSCMHFNRAMSCMEVKNEDEFSDESSRAKAASHCSFNDAKVLSPFKNKGRRDWQHTASETSNLLSASSSPDSFSENSQNKTTMNKLLSKPMNVKKAITSSSSNQQKGLECDSDSISCISGPNDGKMFDAVQSDGLERKHVARNSTSVGDSVPGQGACANKVNNQRKRGFSDCENEVSWNKTVPSDMIKKESIENDPTVALETKDAMGMGNNSCSQNDDEPSECCGELAESYVEKLASTLKSQTSNEDIHTTIENCKTGLARSSSSGSMKIYPCSDSGVGPNNVEQAAESMKCSTSDEKAQKLNVSPDLSDTREHLQSQANDEADESELEDDVKVCDICGDAGREESLAFCSRCSDGAEHTYCMRVMVDKVPEGDWLCEECMMKEEAENQKVAEKQEKLETELGSLKTSNLNGKSQTAGNSEYIPKMDAKSLDVEANRSIKAASSSLSTFKRRLESLELAPAAKRLAVDSGIGTPKSSSPSKKPALSREASFKNFEKGKAKPFHSTPLSGGNFANSSQGISNSATSFVSNSSKTQSLLQSPRGTLLKSSSFNMNSKPKVKLVDEKVCQKKKLVRDRAASDVKKDGVIRTMSKSQSFRTASPRSTSTEAKVKLQSSCTSRTEDNKGLKLSKERSIERISSLKSDRCLNSSSAGLNVPALKAEQKMTFRGENSSMLSPGSSYRDPKAVQGDGKLNDLLRTSSFSANNGEAPKSLAGRGDFKRQSSMLSRGAVPLSSNGNPEQKQSQVDLMEEPVTSFVTDRLDGNSGAIQLDVLLQSQEPANQDRKVIEASISHSKQSSAAGDKTIRCHQCQEIGHAVQFCPAGSSHIPVLEASGTQNSQEVRNKNTKLKGLVEAALQKRSIMNKRSRVSDQSDEFTVSSTELGNEVASNDQALTLPKDMKSQNLQSTEANGERESDSFAASGGYKLKRSMNDLTYVSSTSIPQELFYIPEHNYIWQGGFHVKRSGRPIELCDGIQGHLSTCASPKVHEVVSRFSPRVTLEEVSRLSAWPSQFQKCATEDNIALYFFAKDHESYAKSYKRLLENMIKNDLALKANFDGVELLIFPSTVLPEKSQRWNMLFFLWGVFKGKRAQGADTISSCEMKLSGANKNMPALERELLPDQVLPDSHEGCAGNIDDQAASGKLSGTEKVTKCCTSSQLTIPYSGVDLNCSTEESPIDDEHSGPKSCYSTGFDANICNPLSKMLMNNAESKGINSHMEAYSDRESKGNSTALPMREGSIGNGQVTENRNCISKATLADCHTISLDRQDASVGSFKVLPASIYAAQNSGALGIRVVEKAQPKMQNTSCDIEYEDTAEQEVKSDSRISTIAAVLNDAEERGDGRSKIDSGRKRLCSASLETGMQACADACTSSTSQERPFYASDDCVLIEGDEKFKKMRRSNSETNAGVSSRDEDSYRGVMHNGSSFPIKVNDLDEAYGDMGFPSSSGTAERRLFPVDLHPVNDFKSRGNVIPVQVLSSDDEDQLEELGAPNLELALGGERRPSKRGVLPLFAGLAGRKADHGKQLDLATENRDDDLSSSLSLSLAFPFPDKEQRLQHVPKPEQLLPERRVDTSLFLFGSFGKP